MYEAEEMKTTEAKKIRKFCKSTTIAPIIVVIGDHNRSSTGSIGPNID